MLEVIENLRNALMANDLDQKQHAQLIYQAKCVIRECEYRFSPLDLMVANFMKDRSDAKLYGQIMDIIRAEIPVMKLQDMERYNYLTALRNRMYQYRPLGYIAPGRSANFDF